MAHSSITSGGLRQMDLRCHSFLPTTGFLPGGKPRGRLRPFRGAAESPLPQGLLVFSAAAFVLRRPTTTIVALVLTPIPR